MFLKVVVNRLINATIKLISKKTSGQFPNTFIAINPFETPDYLWVSAQ